MSVEEQASGLVKQLTDFREMLGVIVRKAKADEEFEAARERLRRWKDQLIQFLKDEVSLEEASNLQGTDLRVFTAGDYLGNLIDEARLYDGALQALIEDIEQSSSPIRKLLSGSHPSELHILKNAGTGTMVELDIFISHSSKDAKIARSLIESPKGGTRRTSSKNKVY